jgi:hypothetical protein
VKAADTKEGERLVELSHWLHWGRSESADDSWMNSSVEVKVKRGRARLSEGNLDEAMAMDRAALTATLGHFELVSDLMPELERLRRKNDAESYFKSPGQPTEKCWRIYRTAHTREMH